MKKIITNSLLLLFCPVFIVSCSGDDLENLGSAEYNAKMLDVFIYDSDLVGEWAIESMIVDRDIDLNGDGKPNKDLLQESSCFEKMVYTFRGDKTFTIVNPALELTNVEDNDEFKCQSPSTISGKWSLKDDTLTLYIRRNYQEFQERKQLSLLDNQFYLEVNKDESKDFINDKGNNSVSGLTVVVLKFKRTLKN